MAKLTRAELNDHLKNVKLFSLDVDGVLTDGGLYYSEDGSELRRFNVKDGMGIKLAQAAGIEFAIISASITPAIEHRAKRLGIDHVHIGCKSKVETLRGICTQLGISMDSVAHMGDDMNDLPVFEAVGLALAPADAVREVRNSANFVAEAQGGRGCVREICDLAVNARKADVASNVANNAVA